MPRAMWKGVIRFGDEAVPVKLYAAVESKGLGFRLLHDKDEAPVRQRMVNPATGDEVPYEEVQRGYELADGAFVRLDPEELEELEPAPSRDIEIARFLDPALIDHQWYDRPYFLGPDGDDDAYAAFAAALAAEDKEAVARWTMRKKAYIGALRSDGEHLLLVTLRHAEQLIPLEELGAPDKPKLDPKELKLARQLVEALVDEFDPGAYRDEYRDRVMALIEAKRQGKPIEMPAAAERAPSTGSLADSLRESLKAAKERKVALTAEATQ